LICNKLDTITETGQEKQQEIIVEQAITHNIDHV